MELDAHHLPDIARHSIEKIRRHDYYAALFAAAMRRKWRHLVYIGLYAGAGRARLKDSGEIVETTALSVVRLGFTKYIFVDSDRECIDALRHRIAAVDSDADVAHPRRG